MNLTPAPGLDGPGVLPLNGAMKLGRDFALLFAASALSEVGSAMMPVALTFAVLGAGRSAGALGAVLAAQTIPMVVLLLAGGVVGDRWPRRRVMVAADLLRCAAQIALAAIVIDGGASMTALIGLTAVIGVGSAFFHPASGGLVPQIVHPDRLSRANGALGFVHSMSMVAGPSVAGLLVSGVGAGWAIGLDGASYAASALCLAFVRAGPAAPREAGRPMSQDLREGLRAFVSRRWLVLLIGQFGALNLLLATPLLVVEPTLLAQSPDGARVWGLLLSAMGAGGVAAALVMLRWKPARLLVAVQVVVTAMSAAALMLAARPSLAGMLACGATFGAAGAMINILLPTAMQREVPGAILSRVMSVNMVASMGLAPFGYALAGPASAWLGPEGAMAAGGCCALASVAAMLSFSEIRRFGAAAGSAVQAPSSF